MGYSENGASQVKQDRPMSRIENDVETIKRMTERVQDITSRVVRHARSLGYFEPPSKGETSVPTPVTTTLADAITALDRAIDGASGSLNVFE